MAEVPATEEIKDKDTQLPEPGPRASNSDNLVPDLYYGTAEKTLQESPWVYQSLYKPYNQDDLYQKTADYSIYEDMEVDDQVSIAMQLKRDLVIGSGWTIVTESEGDQHIADALYCDLEEEPEVSLDDLLEELIDVAYTKGFSITEKLFKIKDDGSLALKNLKTRYPNSWLLHTDKYGNVERYEQQSMDGSIDVDPMSIIHYINNPRHQNPYGKSDLRAAYEAWVVKRHVVRFYSIFLEKSAGPIPVAKYDKNVPNNRVLEVHNAIKNFQAKTAITLPKDFDIEFLEAGKGGEAYVQGLNLFNMYIGRALCIPDLLGFQGSATGGGSLSLGQSQVGIFYKHIMRRRRSLERIINKHIIQPLCVWNYGLMEEYPKFKLNPISDDKGLDYARTYLELVKGKIYKPTLSEINHFKDLIKFPLSDEDDIEWIEAGSSGGFNPFDPMGGAFPGAQAKPPPFGEQGASDDAQEIEGEESNDGTSAEAPEGAAPADQEKQSAEPEKATEVQFKDLGHYSVYKKPDGGYSARVDYKALAATLDSDQKTIQAQMAPIVAEILEDLFDQIKKKNILGNNPKPERIETIKLKNLKKLQQLLNKNLRQSYIDQKAIARRELLKQNFAQPLPSDKFLEFLYNETFQYVGDWEYQIMRRARNELANAIKDGRPLSSVITNLEETANSYSDASIERYSRTKLTEVMNRARVEEFESTGIVAAYQYSAVMDDRTSDICAGLHGKIFKAGSEPVPPMHFNCRSVLIPITIYEDFNVDSKVGSKPIEQFITDNIGDGFSKK